MKIPPNNLEAEKMVLGSILIDNRSIAKVIPILKPEDFYSSANFTIYMTMRILHKEHQPIDCVSVQSIIETGSPDSKIGSDYYSILADITPTSTGIVHYAKIVKEKSNLRKIYRHAQTTCEEIEKKKPEDLIIEFESLIKTVRGDIPEKEMFKANDEKERILEIYKNGGLAKGIVPGDWKNLGRFYSIRKGLFTVITGAPGSGKTNILDCMAVDLAEREGWKMAVFSPENHPLSFHIVNLMEKSSGYSMKEKSTERMTFEGLKYALDFVDNHFTFIKPAKSPTIDHILSIASLIKEKNGLDGLVIDPYNMLDNSRNPRISENEYVRGFLKSIREFAREKDTHVFLVAHPRKLLKRKDGNFEPASAYDICGSSEFFNLPDFILSVWRNVIDKTKPVEIFIQKARHKELGRPGKALLEFIEENATYKDSWDY
jgi:replicative DNA helicase